MNRHSSKSSSWVTVAGASLVFILLMAASVVQANRGHNTIQQSVMKWTNEWQKDIKYQRGDVTQYNDVVFICTEKHTAELIPSDDPDHWEKIERDEPVRVIFVTSSRTSGNIGGIAGADLVCTQEATATGLAGEYMALLSTSTSDLRSVLTSFAPAKIVSPNGTVVSPSMDAFLYGTVQTPTNVLASGVRTELDYSKNFRGIQVWTGVSITANHLDGRRCEDWTSASSNDQGSFGILGYNYHAPTHVKYAQQACNTELRFHCMAKDTAIVTNE